LQFDITGFHIPAEIYGRALRAAARQGHENIVRLLVKRNSNVSGCSSAEVSGLCTAESEGFDSIVRYLVLEAGVDPNADDAFGGTPLMAAAAGGKVSVMEFLVEKGANVNAEGGFYGSALHSAISGNGYNSKTPEVVLDAVRFLVEHGADLNVRRGNHNLTAIEEARNNATWASCGEKRDIMVQVSEYLAQYTTADEKK
jgi:ankyrin repeat protein